MFGINWIVSVIFIAHIVCGQGIKKEKEPCFIYPSEDGLAVIANPSDCPIEIITAYRASFLSGGGRDIYQIRNRATKPIKLYTIASVTSAGGGYESSIEANHSSGYFLPGQIRPKSLDDWNLDIVPLTNQLRDKYKLNGTMRAILIFMIVRVEFADGSVYDATPVYESLKKFFDKNAIIPDEEKQKK